MPIVYKIIHRSHPKDVDTEKLIGFFSSLPNCNDIIQQYRNLDGFKEFPKQFKIKKYIISKKVYDSMKVYYIQYYCDETNCIDYNGKTICVNFGVWSNKKRAEQMKRLISKILLLLLKRGSVVCEQYTLDECEWQEGFTVIS